MRKIFLLTVVLGLVLVVGVGCSGKKDPASQNPSANSQLPAGHPSLPGDAKPSGKPVDLKEVTDKVTKTLDEKFTGEWKVSGTTLNKGAYKENDNFGIVDEVAKIYPGSMISLFVGQDRISSTIKGPDGKRVLKGYPTPEAVGQTMKSGTASVAAGSSMGSTGYQKVYLPLKSGDKTVAVMTLSIAQ